MSLHSVTAAGCGRLIRSSGSVCGACCGACWRPTATCGRRTRALQWRYQCSGVSLTFGVFQGWEAAWSPRMWEEVVGWGL